MEEGEGKEKKHVWVALCGFLDFFSFSFSLSLCILFSAGFRFRGSTATARAPAPATAAATAAHKRKVAFDECAMPASTATRQ